MWVFYVVYPPKTKCFLFLETFIALLLLFFAHFYISTIILVKSHNAVQINNKSKQKWLCVCQAENFCIEL